VTAERAGYEQGGADGCALFGRSSTGDRRCGGYLETWLKVVVIAAAIGSSSCSGAIREPGGEDDDRSAASVGQLGFTLLLDGAVELGAVTYAIAHAGAIVRTGTIQADSAGRGFRALFQLPPAREYTVSLEAVTQAGAVCHGSADFDIRPALVTPVNVAMRCPGPSQGRVQIDGIINVCPVLEAIQRGAEQVGVGASIVLRGVASDLDAYPAPLTYIWTASSGQLSHPAGSRTDFSCGAAGPASLSLAVSDGDPGCTGASATIGIVCVDVDLAGGLAGSAAEAGDEEAPFDAGDTDAEDAGTD